MSSSSLVARLLDEGSYTGLAGSRLLLLLGILKLDALFGDEGEGLDRAARKQHVDALLLHPHSLLFFVFAAAVSTPLPASLFSASSRISPVSIAASAAMTARSFSRLRCVCALVAPSGPFFPSWRRERPPTRPAHLSGSLTPLGPVGPDQPSVIRKICRSSIVFFKKKDIYYQHQFPNIIVIFVHFICHH